MHNNIVQILLGQIPKILYKIMTQKQLLAFSYLGILLIAPGFTISLTSYSISQIASLLFIATKQVGNLGIGMIQMAAYGVKSTAQMGCDLLINKPIKLITYPFRKLPQNTITSNFSQHKFTKQDVQKMTQKFKQESKKLQRLFVVIKQVSKIQGKLLHPPIIGLFDRSEPVKAILVFLRQKITSNNMQSVQFYCKNTIVNMQKRIGDLPLHETGVLQLTFTTLQTFG